MNDLLSINSVGKVISAIRRLDEILPGTKLSNLRVFNHTYLIISTNVNKKIRQGKFDFPDQMIKLDIDFAHLYFKALENYKSGESVPKAWEVAFTFYCDKKNHPFIYLILGANAHINHDLAFSLKNTIFNEIFYSDYQKAEKIIFSSIKEIINSISKTDKHTAFLYELIMKFLIKRWRKSAWENYLKLRTKKIKEENIEKNALKIANRILFIASIVT